MENSMVVHRTEFGEPLRNSCRCSRKFAVLVELGGNISGCMEAHGSFHGFFSWKLQLMEAMEDSTSTDSRQFHVFPWKLPLTSMEVNLLPPTSMLRWTSIYFHGSFHGS